VAGAAVAPVRVIGDLGYVVTNLVAQIVGAITGVTGQHLPAVAAGRTHIEP
jgi:hypothetical protein